MGKDKKKPQSEPQREPLKPQDEVLKESEAKELRAKAKSTSQVANASYSLAGMVLAFALGWGGRGMCVEDAAVDRCNSTSPAQVVPPPPQGGDGAPTDLWEQTTHPGMARDGFNWTQLSMSRSGNFPPSFVKVMDVSELQQPGGQFAVWHRTYARSIPAVIHGLARNFSARFENWHIDDYLRAWGEQPVVVAFSPDEKFQRGVAHPEHGRVVISPDRQRLQFREFVRLQRAQQAADRVTEHLAVQQSPSRDFSEFGLPALPPLLEDLVGPTLQARNFWAATPPKMSVLHYDWQDSLLMQLSGTKKFTIIDPARLHTAYPCVQKMMQLQRTAAGEFRPVITDRELDNFPLVNVTHPDLRRHPLYGDSNVFTVEIKAGDALVLPAYWYHQVESFADPGKLNVAVNFWFQGHSLATRLYRTLRENVFINCTEPVKPGVPHPCRD